MSDLPSPGVASPAPQPTTEPIESQSIEAAAPESEAIEGLQEQAENGTPKEQVQAKKMLKSLKIKFNGKEYDEALPFEIPDDEASTKWMREQLQRSKLSASKAQEYSSLEKEVSAFIQELKANPKKALANPAIGVDIKKLAQEIIEEEIENAAKSPEQLEKERLEQELKTLKEEREKEKESGRQKEFERLQEQEYERYDQAMSKALEGSTLPKSPYIIKKMADYMLMGLQDGMDLQPADVIGLVEQDMQNDLKEMFAVMPDDVIEAVVGKDVIGRIRKKSIANAKAKQQPPVPLKSGIKDVAAEPKKEVKEPVNYKKFFGI